VQVLMLVKCNNESEWTLSRSDINIIIAEKRQPKMVIFTASVDTIFTTFLTSLRSIATVITMALTGYYLHRTDCIGTEGKRTLAVLSQQVTIPLLLFSKIIYCNQNWSSEPCPDVTKSLSDVWMLLFWPIYVIGVGLLVGLIVAKTTRAPKHHVRSILAACAFGNSNSLPITMLNVVHANFPSTSDLRKIDPNLFLSIFLISYPILQWGLGGYLLTPDDKNVALMGVTLNKGMISTRSPISFDELAPPVRMENQAISSILVKDINNQHKSIVASCERRNLSSTDESLYISERYE
jgi:Membrane transport protein